MPRRQALATQDFYGWSHERRIEPGTGLRALDRVRDRSTYVHYRPRQAWNNGRTAGHDTSRNSCASETGSAPGVAVTRCWASVPIPIRQPDPPPVYRIPAVKLRNSLSRILSRNPGRVDLGGCPPKSPTDPGVHIRAPGSSSHEFATRAIRRRYVDMVQVAMYLACFPSTAHETAPPSLDGVPRVGSPASTVL